MTRYSPEAVNASIASSNRSGRKIGRREATLIHRLLAGRSISVARNDGNVAIPTQEVIAPEKSAPNKRIERRTNRPGIVPAFSVRARRSRRDSTEKGNPTMSKNAPKKTIRLHRSVYENAGAMIRSGMWTVEYAAFHFSTVTQTLAT